LKPARPIGNRILEITHQRASYAAVCVDRRRIFLKTAFWVCPYPASLADSWVETTTPHGKLMMTIPGGLAEFERELIKNRCEDGRRRAIAGCVSAER
jgi:hypothetical protein